MKEAMFYEKDLQEDLSLRCHLCNHKCRIKNNRTGLCKIRKNIDGKLISLVYGKIITENIDPIEKKPVFHFLPGSLSYSIATVGCNFKCQHCQNYQISQYKPHPSGDIPGTNRTPEQIVKSANNNNCQSISYTYIEPTIFFEFAYETAILAKERGLYNIFVSNGYTSKRATEAIAPYLDANNIDLKSFSDKFYREICGAKLAPVLDTIQLMKELGVWVEVTTLIIPGLNDGKEEITAIATFLANIDPNIPWHVSRFHPTYKMTDRPSTPSTTLHLARQIGKDCGLNYVYTGNIPGQGGENTICPNCQKVLIERVGYSILTNKIKNSRCQYCQTTISGFF